MAIGTIFAGFKLFGFIGKAFNFVGGLIAKGVELVLKYPVQAAVIVGVCAGAWFLNSWAYERGSKSRDVEVGALTKQITDMTIVINERNSKITALESFSGVLASAIQTNVQALKTDLAALTLAYEKNLAEARKNPKVITKVVEVKVPGEDRVIEVVVQDGNVVCDRYPEGYSTTVNQMVERTRQTMRKALQ